MGVNDATSFPSINWPFGIRKSFGVFNYLKRASFKTKKRETDDFWGVHLRRCKSMHLQRCGSIPAKVDHCFNPNINISDVPKDQFYSLDNVSVINDDALNCAVNDQIVIVDDYQTVRKYCEEETRDDEDFHDEKKSFAVKIPKKLKSCEIQNDKLLSRVICSRETEAGNTESLGKLIKKASRLNRIDQKAFSSKVFHQIFGKKFRTKSVRNFNDILLRTEDSSVTYHFCKK